MELKMNKREYQLRKYYDEIKEKENMNRDISFKFYKSLGLIDEEIKETKESYQTMVRREIYKIKKKINFKHEIKEEKKKHEQRLNTELLNLRNLIFGVMAIYVVVIIYILYIRYKRRILEKQLKEKYKEKMLERRMSSYIYFNNKD
jgi:hypothetical protein